MAGPGPRAIIPLGQSSYNNLSLYDNTPHKNTPLPRSRSNSADNPKLPLPIHITQSIYDPSEEERLAVLPRIMRRPNVKTVFSSLAEDDNKQDGKQGGKQIVQPRIPLATIEPGTRTRQLKPKQQRPTLRRSVSDNSLTLKSARKSDENTEAPINRMYSQGSNLPRDPHRKSEFVFKKMISPDDFIITDKKKSKTLNESFLRHWNKKPIALPIPNLYKLVDSIAENLIRSTLKGENLIPCNQWFEERIKRCKDEEGDAKNPFYSIAQKIPDILINKTLLPSRFESCYNFLNKFERKKKRTTVVTDVLGKAFASLLSIYAENKEKGFLLSKTSRVNHFNSIMRFDDATFESLNVFPKPMPRDIAKIKATMFHMLGGDIKDSMNVKDPQQIKDPVFIQLLNKLGQPNEVCTRLFKNFTSAAFENITKIEHSWQEPLEHELTPMPISRTSITPLMLVYNREGKPMSTPITINNNPLFAKNEKVLEDRQTYFLHLFYKLHKALKPELEIDEKSLIEQIKYALEELPSGEFHDPKEFVGLMPACFDQLRYGTPDAWSRAHQFVEWRFGNLLERENPNLKCDNDQSIGLNFHVESKHPETSYVEQLKSYKIVLKEDNSTVKANFTVSLKVMNPSKSAQKFIVKFVHFAIKPEAGTQITKDIKNAAVNFNDLDIEREYLLLQLKLKPKDELLSLPLEKKPLKCLSEDRRKEEDKLIAENFPQGGIKISHAYSPN